MTHDSVYLNVLLDEVVAGGGVQKTLEQQPSNYKYALKVIHKTKKIASHPITAHSRVPAEVVKKVQLALLKLGESERGKKLLIRIPISEIGISSISDYQPLKEMNLSQFYVN